jgi:hypothetical protein
VRLRPAWPRNAQQQRAAPPVAVWLVRVLVLANCALAAAWLGGVSGIGEPTRIVTLLSCIGIVGLAVRENPEAHRGLSGRLAVRLTLASALVLAGVILLALVFR